MTGGTARASLTGLLCLDYLSLESEGPSSVSPPVWPAPLQQPLQHQASPLADQETGQVPQAGLPPHGHQQGEEEQEGQSGLPQAGEEGEGRSQPGTAEYKIKLLKLTTSPQLIAIPSHGLL